MQNESGPTLPPRESEGNNLLLVAGFSIFSIIAVVFFLRVGVTGLSGEQSTPYMTFSDTDEHLVFHFFTDVKRRAFKTVDSVHQVPRDYRQVVLVTERGSGNPLQLEKVHLTNLNERLPTGKYGANELAIGKVIFALELQSQVAREEAQKRPAMMPPQGPKISPRQFQQFRREVENVDTSQYEKGVPKGVDIQSLQECANRDGANPADCMRKNR